MTTTWEQVTIKLLKKYLKQHQHVLGNIQISVDMDMGNINVKCSTKSGEVAFTVLEGKPWASTKKYMDSVMQDMPNMHEPKECTICCNMTIHFCRCAQCCHNSCIRCTVGILKHNQGVIVCPYCKFKVGRKLLPHHVELVAAKMLSVMGEESNEPSDHTWN